MLSQDTVHQTNSSPRPYVSDGGFSLSGAILTSFAGIVVALAVGLLAGVIGQYFYMVMIFPIAIGFAVGGAQVAVIGRTKIRNPLVCGFAGLLAGVVAVATMHYVDYLAFRKDVADTAARFAAEKASVNEIEDSEMRELYAMRLAAYEADPIVVEMNSVDSFIDYIDFAAKQGVELSSSAGTRGSSNLGYAGTYIYWSIESLVIAGICVFMTRSRANKPYCIDCDSWMREKEIASLNCDAKQAVKAIASGSLQRLPTLFAANAETAICLFDCETCAKSPAVIQPCEVSYNNGSRIKKAVGRYVLTETMIQELASLFVDQTKEDASAEQLLADVNELSIEANRQHSQADDEFSPTR